MFSHLSVWMLAVIFLVSGAVIWIAGIHLSNATDFLSKHFGLGEALGGMILLALATNLPEIAIVSAAGLNHNLDLAVGNIFGGIAIQTVVLVILDVFGLGWKGTLAEKAGSLTLALEGVLVIGALTAAIMGTQLPPTLALWRFAPGDVLIVALWIVGLKLLSKARQGLPYERKGGNDETSKDEKKEKKPDEKKPHAARAIAVFTVAALATLAAGVALEQTGDSIAAHLHMTGVLFGATILAAATSLPEVSTGLAAVKLGDYELAFSDIFGGNAFLPVLFLLATLLSGSPVLPHAHKSDIYLAALGILLTGVYLYGMIFRPRRQVLRMGLDSLTVLILYLIGVVGLFALARAG